ncbi:MAG: CHAT domain-containing protein [Calditrichaeota bacterium]|nr:MAG: CHAT domain-containing protein [Calditrichota bacterium]MBL1206178.1 CHAT domain-containing protein [Calditrichota bacterium]NOG46003.1 CHAT domain-containing protein [Calditrichota bacterium]
MQKQIQIILITTILFFTTSTYPQVSSAKDSIEWAFKKIERGQKHSTDSLENAIKYYTEAIRIGKKAKNNHLLYNAFFRLGYQYYLMDNRGKAHYFFQQSIEVEKHLEASELIFNTSYYVAVIHYLNDDYSSALKSLTAAEKSTLKNPNIKRRLLIYTLRVKIYSYLDQYDLAKQLLNKAIKISLEEKDTPYLHSFYEALADLAKKGKKYDEAITYYKKSNQSLVNLKSSKVPEFRSYNYNQIGNCYFLKKDFQLARKHYLIGHRIADENNIQYYALNNLLALVKLETQLGQYKKAFEYMSLVDSIDTENDIGLEIMKNSRIGNLFYKTNELNSALFYYKRSLKLTEERKGKINISRFRIGFNSRDYSKSLSIARIYKTLYKKTNNISLFDSLFKYINISRSRSLFENASRLNLPSTNPYLASMEKIDDFYKSIRTLEQTGPGTIEELDRLKYTLVSKQVEIIKDDAASFKTITRNEYQKYLSDNNSCSIIYTVNEHDQFAIYLDGQNTKVIDLNINPDSLQNNIKKLFESAFNNSEIKNLVFNAKLSHSVYLSLWDQIEKNINILKNVIIIPDQNVLNFPFDILMYDAPEYSIYSINGQQDYLEKLLIQKYNFSYLPSANIIKAFKKRNENKDVFLIANPHFNLEYKINQEIINHSGWSFEPLMYSNAEIKSIKEYYEDAVVFNREKAVKGNFENRLSSAKIIHFATHAFIDTVFDLFSGLVLTLPNDLSDNGFLLGFEISQLDLNCDLVTLSACESGRGKIVSAEGVMGLPRLFLNSGARSVLMTLWKIDDMQSASLIPVFYENINQKKLSKIEAVGEAKRMYLRNKNNNYFSHPFFWAAFSLYGDAGTIHSSRIKTETNNMLVLVLFIFAGLLVLVFYQKRLNRQIKQS